MRRSGMPSGEIDDVRWVYKTLYRRGLSLPRAVEQLEERAAHPIVAEYLAFPGRLEAWPVPRAREARRGTGTD